MSESKKDLAVFSAFSVSGTRERVEERAAYERPSLTKKRSVSRVTLFSGSGASGASGLTSA